MSSLWPTKEEVEYLSNNADLFIIEQWLRGLRLNRPERKRKDPQETSEPAPLPSSR
jgi:hypothetical protein